MWQWNIYKDWCLIVNCCFFIASKTFLLEHFLIRCYDGINLWVNAQHQTFRQLRVNESNITNGRKSVNKWIYLYTLHKKCFLFVFHFQIKTFFSVIETGIIQHNSCYALYFNQCCNGYWSSRINCSEINISCICGRETVWFISCWFQYNFPNFKLYHLTFYLMIVLIEIMMILVTILTVLTSSCFIGQQKEEFGRFFSSVK